MHQFYNKLEPHEQHAVDYAYAQMVNALKLHLVGIAGDDRAERVVDGIARGIIESRGERFA